VTKTFRVESNPAAEDDIKTIFEHIAADNLPAAARWLEGIERKMRSLETLPLAFEVIPESSDLGMHLHHKLYGQYRIIYRVENERVLVLRVIHGARLLNRSFFDS
jgi:toxin ParE1/3/4